MNEVHRADKYPRSFHRHDTVEELVDALYAMPEQEFYDKIHRYQAMTVNETVMALEEDRRLWAAAQVARLQGRRAEA